MYGKELEAMYGKELEAYTKLEIEQLEKDMEKVEYELSRKTLEEARNDKMRLLATLNYQIPATTKGEFKAGDIIKGFGVDNNDIVIELLEERETGYTWKYPDNDRKFESEYSTDPFFRFMWIKVDKEE